jgi:ankyrin repeat protein
VRTAMVVVVCVVVLVAAVMLVRRRSAQNELFAYADRGDAQALKAAVTADNVNATDKWGWTPLMHAASRGHYDACDVLLAAGADAARKDRKGYSALEYVKANLQLASPAERERTAAFLKQAGISLAGVDPTKAPTVDTTQLLRVKQLLEPHP